MRKAIFVLSYAVLHTAPLYGVLAVVMGGYETPALIALAPVVLVYLPAALYLLTRRCRQCREPVYTTEHLRAAPGGVLRFPLTIFRECPECGHGLSIGD